ncbi:MAG: GxxExxY protein [Planctomycetes bacterium]|nr:GxxExxY protein [Planctomycetota bacterium]MCB9934883.1 GxxExxY protein [Planctomycetota bacterium]
MSGKPFTKTDEEIEKIVHIVIGAAIEVHKNLGPGLLEKHYEEALCIELDVRGLKYERQKSVHLQYKDRPIGSGVIDLFVEGRLVVELKAKAVVSELELAIARSYVRIVKEPLGLMLNFHDPAMNDKNAIRRIIAGI